MGLMPALRLGPEVVVGGLHRLGLLVHGGLLFMVMLAEIGYSGGFAAAVESNYHR